jgi:hypothetical protein
MLYSMMMVHSTGSYTGVDYGPIPWPDSISETTKKFKAKFFEKSDFVKLELPRKTFDVITSFEVLEHVEAEHAYDMMRKMRMSISKQGHVFLSTPCYDPKVGPADNHVNEMSFEGFKALIEAAGFEIDKVWGTFASQKDYKKLMTEAQRSVFDSLIEYYDSGVASCMFAPLFPAQARNCIWKLRPGSIHGLEAADLKKLATPEHGSSELWPKQLKKIMKEIR